MSPPPPEPPPVPHCRPHRRPPVAVLRVAAWLAAAALARAQSIEVVSVADDGSLADADAHDAVLSDDGNRVAFVSSATNLVAGDGNGVADVFVRDRAAGTTRRVSVSSAGVEADGDSGAPAISADGRFVAFESRAGNLVAGDDGLWSDVFVHELASGTTVRVSVSSAGQPGDRNSFAPSLSADGRFVAFASLADDLVASDGNDVADVFLHDRKSATTIRVSVRSDGGEADDSSGEPALSRDGLHVAFSSAATNLDPGDGDGLGDVYVRDLAAATTALASVDGSGAKGDDESFAPALSQDGRLVAFSSLAANLVAGDAPFTLDLFVRDLVAGTTVAADVDSDGRFGANEASQSSTASISADGRFVTFSAPDGNFVAGDTNHWDDEFVHDFATPLTSRANVAVDGTQADGPSGGSRIGGDGRCVVFSSSATTLLPGVGNGARQIFLRERRLDRASWSNFGAGHAGTLGIPALTADGDPVVNHDVALAIGNSAGKWTLGLLFLGATQVQWPTSWGSDLLVDPAATIVLALPPAGGSFAGRIAPDERFVGVPLFGQVLQVDAGASRGVSFTAGIELALGY